MGIGNRRITSAVFSCPYPKGEGWFYLLAPALLFCYTAPLMITLKYEPREKSAKAATLRRTGKIPAVFYGKRVAARSITVPEKAFAKALAAAGQNTALTLAGEGKEFPALIHDTMRHPVSGHIEHIDFYAFEPGQKVAVRVPLEFTGVSPAVKEKGGVLVKVLRELHIEAEPLKLPHTIDIDITSLVDFGSQILAKNISLPEGVTLKELPEEVVASVYEPKEEKEEVVPPPDLSQIEVMKKGKEEKESETPASPETATQGTPAKEVKEKKGEKK
jgi:large subunit ribosomal protein L25